jgi:hypothetical protein
MFHTVKEPSLTYQAGRHGYKQGRGITVYNTLGLLVTPRVSNRLCIGIYWAQGELNRSRHRRNHPWF